MIHLTQFNGKKVYINAELIKSVEKTPDTVISLINGEKILVRDQPEEIIKRIIQYKRIILNPELDDGIGD